MIGWVFGRGPVGGRAIGLAPEKGTEGDRTPNCTVVYASYRSTNGLPDCAHKLRERFFLCETM